ncbi:uncharacterized protein LOC128200832 isoform X2 [Galleria mellonella]|uniref:Uncharacterized protein LOC128200832 isoform X2 n=1 Tax=Galleria mellonella TaxID=7137 RepID=A0ABM3MK13_GALME|nr:uncharacterized protein LOC128200832 isoform X2 [Galleria mellonella]
MYTACQEVRFLLKSSWICWWNAWRSSDGLRQSMHEQPMPGSKMSSETLSPNSIHMMEYLQSMFDEAVKTAYVLCIDDELPSNENSNNEKANAQPRLIPYTPPPGPSRENIESVYAKIPSDLYAWYIKF